MHKKTTFIIPTSYHDGSSCIIRRSLDSPGHRQEAVSAIEPPWTRTYTSTHGGGKRYDRVGGRSRRPSIRRRFELDSPVGRANGIFFSRTSTTRTARSYDTRKNPGRTTRHWKARHCFRAGAQALRYGPYLCRRAAQEKLGETNQQPTNERMHKCGIYTSRCLHIETII